MTRRRRAPVSQLPRVGRYGSNIKKPVEDGFTFDSQAELARYRELKLMRSAKVIKNLEVHPKFPIIIGGIEVRIFSKRFWKTGRQMYYEADFKYWDNEKRDWIIEDVKMESGHRTEVYKIKRALMRAMGYTITEI